MNANVQDARSRMERLIINMDSHHQEKEGEIYENCSN